MISALRNAVCDDPLPTLRRKSEARKNPNASPDVTPDFRALPCHSVPLLPRTFPRRWCSRRFFLSIPQPRLASPDSVRDTVCHDLFPLSDANPRRGKIQTHHPMPPALPAHVPPAVGSRSRQFLLSIPEAVPAPFVPTPDDPSSQFPELNSPPVIPNASPDAVRASRARSPCRWFALQTIPPLNSPASTRIPWFRFATLFVARPFPFSNANPRHGRIQTHRQYHPRLRLCRAPLFLFVPCAVLTSFRVLASLVHPGAVCSPTPALCCRIRRCRRARSLTPIHSSNAVL